MSGDEVLCVMVITGSVKGSCPTGHYCPSPGDQIPCPKGFFNPNTGSTSYEACIPCTPGSYCGTQGLSAPTGPCSPGWYCVRAEITPTPLGKECWPGHYCTGGNAEPVPCPIGTYEPNYGMSLCTMCPIGYYCLAPALTQYSGVCDPGYVCARNSTNPRRGFCQEGHYCQDGKRLKCPAGTFQPWQTHPECRPCIDGSYCATEGLLQPTGKCKSGWYCNQGETEKKPPGQLCPKGHMCKEGFKLPCRSGSSQSEEGQTRCDACPYNHYCNGTGLLAPTAECETGQCCTNSFILPSTCNTGDFLYVKYGENSRPTYDEAQARCVLRGNFKLAEIDTYDEYNRMMAWFNNNEGLTFPTGIWLGAVWSENGYLWQSCLVNSSRSLKWGTWASGQNPKPPTEQCLILTTSHMFQNVDCNETYDILCEKCSDCDGGSYLDITLDTCVTCPNGYYCVKTGIFAPSGTCTPGYSCTSKARSPDKNLCIPGRACPNGYKTKCQKGTYQPNHGAVDCLQCPAGRHCTDTALDYPTGLCEPGSYCPAGTTTEYGIPCPIGHRCPAGSAGPFACESGTYQSADNASHCLPCPEGMYCDKAEAEAEQQSGADSPTHGVVTPKPCPELTYCKIGSTHAVCDDDPYEPTSVNLIIQCNPACHLTHNRYKDMIFGAMCYSCPAAVASYVWSLRQCMGPNVADCHHCKRWVHYISDNDSQNFIYKRMWSHVDVSGWEYYLVKAKVVLENGEEGQAIKMVQYMIPSTDPVDCTVSPASGIEGTPFTVSCGKAPREEGYNTWYWLYSSNVLLYDRSEKYFQDINLPRGSLADNFHVQLQMVTTVTNDTFHTQDFSVQIYPADLYELEELQIMHFSCVPTCTSYMSSDIAIDFSTVCTDCVDPVSTFDWRLTPCDGFQVHTCSQHLGISHDLNNNKKQYTYELSTSQYDVTGWTYFGMLVRVQLSDGTCGTGHHIWKYFDPVPADSVQCNVVPPVGYSLETYFNISCADVKTPEPYDIVYRLYKDITVVEKSPSPNMTNLLLPAADNLNGESSDTVHLHMEAHIQGHFFYRSEMSVEVKPISLDAVNTSFVLSTVAEQIENNDVYKAVAVLDSVVETLNHDQENITGQENSTYSSDEQVEWRTYVVKSIATINTSSFEMVSTVSNLLNKVTLTQEPISQEVQEITTDIYSSLAETLVHALDETEDEIPIEAITDTAGAILQGTTAMVEELTDSLIADKEAQILANTTVTPAPGQTTPKPIPDRNESVEMTGKLLKIVDRVCDALNNRQIEDAEPTIIVSEKVKVAVQKLSVAKIAGASIQLNTSQEDRATSVTMPEDFTPDGSTKDYSLQVVVLEKNPYVWSPESDNIKTPAISITLKDSDNHAVDMKNMSKPLKLSLPTNPGNTSESVRLKVLVEKDGEAFTLKSTYLFPSTATFNLSFSDVGGLVITMPTNLTTIKLYLGHGDKPSLEDILEQGYSYPQEIGLLHERLGDNFADTTNNTVVYFAPKISPEEEDLILDYYGGISLDLDDEQTVQVVQYLDPACLGNETVKVCEGELEMSVAIKTFTVQCLYWSDELDDWSNDGCQVSTDTRGNSLGCACDHMTFFGGSLLDLPATVDPINDFELIKLIENPVVVTTLAMMLFVYLFLVQWARKADRQDQEKVGVIPCNYGSETHMYQYLVCVVTGWWKQAGTSANVFINFTGNLGDSSKVYLTSSSRQCFQSGYEDWFLVTTESCLGNLQSVTVWHDNSGTSPHWYLDQVYIKDVSMEEYWVFICQDWLAVDRGKIRLTSVTVNAISQKEIRIRRKYHFFMKTYSNLRDNHIWISIFSKPARSTFTRVQRLTCGLSFLLTTMLTNIMFYGIPTDDPEDQLSVGVFSISISQLIIGVKSSLLMFPINFLTIQLFCKTQPRVKDRELDHQPTDQSQYDRPDLTSAGYEDHRATGDMYKQMYDNTSATQSFPVLKSRSVNKRRPSVPSVFTVNVTQTLNFDDPGTVASEIPEQNSRTDEKDKQSLEHARRRSLGVALKKPEVKAKSQPRKGLPWWCIYIAWFLVTLTCLTSSYFVLLYGMKYGYERSLEWLVSFLTGFWSNTLLMEPVKTVGLALVLVFILKRPFAFEDVNTDIIRDADKVFTGGVADQTPVHQSYIEPMSSRLLQQIRQRLKLEWSLDMALRDLFVQMTYLVVLLIIIHSQRPVTEAFRCTSTVENLFAHNTNRLPLTKVQEQNDVYSYLRLTVVPAMTEVSGVNPDTPSLGSDFQLVGPYRLRQLRVKQETCDIQLPMMSEGCDPAYSMVAHDKGHYDTAWNQLPVSDNASSATDSWWSYKGSRELKTFTFSGQLATYGGGGFVRQVPSDTQQQLDILADLETSGWLDERTRVVFLEFSLYNPNVDLFSVVIILFEFTNLGAVMPSHYIFTTSLYYSLEDVQVYLMICGVLFIVLNLLFTYFIIVKFKELGWRQYFSDFWNCIEIIKTMLSFSIIGLFIQRLVTVNSVLSDIKPENMDVFVNVYPALLIDFILECVMASVISLVIVKAIKLLQFHWRSRLVTETLAKVRSAMVHYMFMFFIVIMAFSHMSYLVFHNLLHTYKGLGSAMMSNFRMIAGDDNVVDTLNRYRVYGPLFVISFVLTVSFCLVSMYAAILNTGRIELKDEMQNFGKKVQLKTYFISRLKDWFDVFSKTHNTQK